MDRAFLSEIEDAKMRSRLIKEGNIPLIEEILNKEAIELERLQKHSGKPDIGCKLTEAKMREALPEVFSEVNDFLQIKEAITPRCEYDSLFRLASNTFPPILLYTFSTGTMGVSLLQLTAGGHLWEGITGLGISACFAGAGMIARSYLKNSYYDPIFNKIVLERLAETDLIPVAGHEYDHFLHAQGGIPADGRGIFSEGHARGVQKHIAEVYREKEDNDAFLINITDIKVIELKTTYSWLCKALKKQAKASLMKSETKHFAGYLSRLAAPGPSAHDLGSTIFSVYEMQHGKGIYRNMMHGEFNFG